MWDTIIVIKILTCYMSHTGPKWPFVWYKLSPKSFLVINKIHWKCVYFYFGHSVPSSSITLTGRKMYFVFHAWSLYPFWYLQLQVKPYGNILVVTFNNRRPLHHESVMKGHTHIWFSFVFYQLLILGGLLNCEWQQRQHRKMDVNEEKITETEMLCKKSAQKNTRA